MAHEILLETNLAFGAGVTPGGRNFAMPVDLRSRRSTIGCHWSFEKEDWNEFDNA
jgi:hypothetical protein